MKKKTITKGDLKRKAQVLVKLVRTGNYFLIEAMLEAEFPPELAQFMLDKVKFIESRIPDQNLEGGMDWNEDLELPISVSNATWFSKILRGTSAVADQQRAVVLALALVTLTKKNSRYRIAAGKIKHFSVECLGHAVEATQLPAMMNILNRGLGATPNLIRFHIPSAQHQSVKLPFGLSSLPENIKALRVEAYETISLNDFCQPGSLRRLELSASRVFLKALNSNDKGRFQIRIKPESLTHLDPGVAECLLAEGRDLRLERLERLKPEDAEALAGNVGDLHFGYHTMVPEAALAKLRQHKSYTLKDRNQIWRIARESRLILGSGAFSLIDGNRLIKGGHVLDNATGQILTFSKTDFGLVCQRLNGGTTVWEYPMRGLTLATRLIVADDLIVLREYCSISKHSIGDGRILEELSLGETSGGFFGHHLVGKRLFLWSPKMRHQGGKWLIALNLDRFVVEWRTELPGIAGDGMIVDSLGRILFCASGKLLRIDSSTGTIIGRPISLEGSYGVVRKHYPDGSIIAGCEKGYEDPEMKCFSEQGRKLWSLSLRCSTDNPTARKAAFFKDFILMPFCPYNEGSVIWVIDRRTGEILHTVKQNCLEIGNWSDLECFDDRYVLLGGEKGFALYDGLPSSWM